MDDINIEQIVPQLTWQLRRDVLYPQQNKFEMEMPEDVDGIHFGAFSNNALVAVVSVFRDGYDFQFRKLAVDASAQNKGIGSKLLGYITDFAIDEGGKKLWCNARLTAIQFYLNHGFIQTGNLFSKNGIDYEVLEKKLSA